jgi:uncharacterized protein YbjT (DUF2867 family)
MKALVVGATGGTGIQIVSELVRRGISTRAMVRDLDSAKKILPSEVELVVGDMLLPESLENAIAGCDVLLSATGAKPSFDPTAPMKVDYFGMKNLIKTAQQAEIKQLVMVSSLCTSLIFHPLNLFWLVLFWKKRAEEALQKSGINYTIVRPGGLKNEAKLGTLIMSKADSLFEGSIPRATVAQVCVEALFAESAKNKIVEIILQSQPETNLTSEAIAPLFSTI